MLALLVPGVKMGGGGTPPTGPSGILIYKGIPRRAAKGQGASKFKGRRRRS